jgi:hypothetical protein
MKNGILTQFVAYYRKFGCGSAYLGHGKANVQQNFLQYVTHRIKIPFLMTGATVDIPFMEGLHMYLN